MVKIIFTKHARLKLRIYRVHKVKITIKDIRDALDNPIVQNDNEWLLMRVISVLDEKHSLVVIYKTQDDQVIIITFWPAEKGRYESKIQ